MNNEAHLRDLLQKEKNKNIFLEKELEKYKFMLASANALANTIKVNNPIFLKPIAQ
jgi:hypothetical protein